MVVKKGVGHGACFDVGRFPVELVDEVIGGMEAEGCAWKSVFVGEFKAFSPDGEVLCFDPGLFEIFGFEQGGLGEPTPARW